jgi:hypothetical protein
MDDMPETTLGFRAKNTNLGSPLRSSAKARTMSVTDLPLQELLDEVVVATTPTLRERLENWGSD